MSWDYDNAPTDPAHGGKLTAEQACARIDELELALVDLYNLCMAKGWGTSPMVREMLAARRAIRSEQ